MTDQTLNQGGAILRREWSASQWVKRTVAVTFCLGLVATLGAVFTRVIAARVPEQRATLEKLITDRTGLDVRFDNVHFAWDLDGTSAVFTRVELTDPVRGRVHVLAPELRVEFDTWDFLRHHQFSLGHVTLSSPDIELVGDPEESLVQAVAPRATRVRQAGVRADEAAVVHRYLGWAGLMPSGRIEVEGARVHLRRRGERVPSHSFTLSQGVVSRTGGSFSAYGTMLLSQDVGQSLFVSAKLDGLDAGARLSGDLRFIARRVFLEKFSVPGLRGRGTIDAKLALHGGRIASGSWEASARELAMNGEGTRFDHVTVNGTLSRDADAVLLDFTDLQLTRGARLERAPALHARIELESDMKIARTSVRAERIPFMAAEFVAGLLAPRAARAFPELPGGWVPTGGELRALRFDSGERRAAKDSWEISAQVSRLELTRPADNATVGQLAARVHRDARGLVLEFDPAAPATLRMGAALEPRLVQLDGSLALPGDGGLRFEKFSAITGPGNFNIEGEWRPGATRAEPLRVALEQVDHALLRELWTLVAADSEVPAPWSRIERGLIGEGAVELAPAADGAVNWNRSRGTLALTELAASGEDAPRLADGRGKLNFARGGAQLMLESGTVDDLVIDGARLDWPRSGVPRLHALFAGQMDSRLLRGMLRSQGLERLSGAVTLEADARGERELRRPELWRVTARVSGATVPLAGGLPPIEKLSGTIRYSQQLRGLTLQGTWLGGPVEIESRRSASRGLPVFAVSGVAEAGPLLELLGGATAASRVSGQFAWNGSVQPGSDPGSWQVTLGSNLSGLESHLPEPFDKNRARNVPVSAELRIGADGIREFNVDGREIAVRGQVRAGVTSASFEVLGVSGELRRAAGRGSDPEMKIESLDLARAPALLAASGALLPAAGELALHVDQLRYGGREFGALQASIARQGEGMEFSLDTPATALHQLSARGRCEPQGHCQAEFSADTTQLAALLRDVQLPAEWPASHLRASGTFDWPVDSADITRALTGSFELSTQGENAEHQLSARASLADGQIQLADVQGTGPEPDQVFRGSGRVGLVARDYDLTVDYERVALAATAVPSPARARFARAWNAVRGSAARHGWTAAPETRRIQWHGTFD
jgi:hypothetical protein